MKSGLEQAKFMLSQGCLRAKNPKVVAKCRAKYSKIVSGIQGKAQKVADKVK